MSFRTLVRLAVQAALIVVAASGASADDLRDARKDIARQRYSEAEAKLSDEARRSEGERRQEALYLLAGLKRSAREASMIYEEVVRIAPSSEWASRARLELAKIEYALGNYRRAMTILDAGTPCELDEICYFEGVCASIVRDFARARQALARVRDDELGAWARLALAEVDAQTDDADGACGRYRSLVDAGGHPTADYRYGECLEKKGDVAGARRVFTGLLAQYAGTPEAVLAAEKLKGLDAAPQAAKSAAVEPEGQGEAFTGGFTLQFGAFHDRENAIRLAAALRREIPGVRIDSDVVGSREIHRVRYGRFRTRQEAQATAGNFAKSVKEPYTIVPLPN